MGGVRKDAHIGTARRQNRVALSVRAHIVVPYEVS